MTLMICLVEWILGRMEKMRKENFLKSVWLRERGGKMMVESKCFFSWIHQKVCSPKWEEKWMRGNLMVNDKNAHVHFAHAHAHGLHPVHSFLLLLFFFFF